MSTSALESVDDDTQHGMFITGSTRTKVRAVLAKWEESKNKENYDV